MTDQHATDGGARRPDHAPSDHPALLPDKVGVLLSNLGTPDGHDYWSMRRYLGQFLSDRRVVDKSPWLWQPLLQAVILTRRPFVSGANYRKIWNEAADESPLMTITKSQTTRIREALRHHFGDRIQVEFCMRYGNPSTESKTRKLIDGGCRKILFFPLYPQYAGATWATANDRFFQVLANEKWQPAARTVPPYFDQPAYIDALARSVERSCTSLGQPPDILVASYHGLPQRLLAGGDPYHCQCLKTTRLLKQRLGWDDARVMTTFQSRFGPEEWLKPYTVDEVARLARAGTRDIAVIAPAFAADCIETLEEIDDEIRQAFMAAGGKRFTYIPCLNDDDTHIAALCGIIKANLRGWLE